MNFLVEEMSALSKTSEKEDCLVRALKRLIYSVTHTGLRVARILPNAIHVLAEAVADRSEFCFITFYYL